MKISKALALVLGAILLTFGLCANSDAAPPEKKKIKELPAAAKPPIRDIVRNKLSATLTAVPTAYTGACPAKITFNGKITYRGTGKVYYSFARSDGASMPFAMDRYVKFDAPGTKDVSTTWTLGGTSLTSYSGWEMLKLSTCPPGAACISADTADSNKANFTMRCGQETAQVKDLIARRLQVLSPSGPVLSIPVGGPAPVNCEFEYQGSEQLPANSFKTKWTVNGSTLTEQSMTLPMLPNGGIGTSTNWTPTAPGTYNLTCLVDSQNQVAESNERNNTAMLTVSVYEASVASADRDLIARGIRFYEGPFPTNISPQPVPKVGRDIGIACDIGYAGSAGVAGDSYSVKVEVDGATISERPAGFGLGSPAGTEGVFGVRWTPSSAGPHTIVCTVDSRNQVAETNEMNNRAPLAIQVAP